METKKLVRAALFAALTGIGAYLSIPIQPVPFSMQPFFVLLSGVVLGANYGALSQLIYLLIGAAGIPVFSGGASGIGAILGPTGGFLMAFVLVGFVTGKLVEIRPNPNYLWMVFSMLMGLVCLYAVGVYWLGYVANLSLTKAFVVGGAPFIPFDIIKAFIAGLIGVRLRKALK